MFLLPHFSLSLLPVPQSPTAPLFLQWLVPFLPVDTAGPTLLLMRHFEMRLPDLVSLHKHPFQIIIPENRLVLSALVVHICYEGVDIDHDAT